MIERYIVEDQLGNYQAGYNVALGEKKSKAMAYQTAKQINGKVVAVEETGESKVIFNKTQAK